MKCLLNDIYDRPGLLNKLNRKQKLLALDQLMVATDLIVRAIGEMKRLKRHDFDLIDSHPTVDEWIGRHGVPCPPGCPCKCH